MSKKPTENQVPGNGDDDVPAGKVCIKRRSRVPGVMITQYVERVPGGKATPDFTRKPVPLTIQETKLAYFKAVVNGIPAPTVTWGRNKGDLTDPEKYINRYDEKTNEYFLEMPNVSSEQADTYKCYATNEFGQAVCVTTLNVIEVGFKKPKPEVAQTSGAPEDFRKMLKKKVVRTKPVPPKKKEGEIDPKFWEVLLSSAKKDYEKVCRSYGITDFRPMLKRLNQMKKEREDEQKKVVESLEKEKQIEMQTDGSAEFSLNMKLKDPNSNIYLYKDGVQVNYGNGDDHGNKHSLKQSGESYVFSIKDVKPEDSGFYQVDVENTNVLCTDLNIVSTEFVAKLKDVKAKEGEGAIFECVLSNPVPSIGWFRNNVTLEHGDKYDITVSEDKLTHKMEVKGCTPADSGVFTVMAGVTHSSASLAVEAGDGTGKDTGSGEALDQQAAAKGAGDSGDGRDGGDGGDGKGGSGDGSGDGSGGDGTGGDGGDGEDKNKKGVGTGPLLPETKIDPTIVSGLSDVYAVRGQPAQLECKLDIKCDGAWFKDGEKLSPKVGLDISKVDTSHQLKIARSLDDDAGLYRFEAGGCKSEASVSVGDIPEFDADDLLKFSKPVIVKVGQTAAFKMPYTPQEGLQVQWFKDGVELKDSGGVKVMKETNHSRLLLKDCLRSDGGEIKIKLSNPFGAVEATCQLIVIDKPGPPEGPVEVVERSSTVIEVKWNPPLDDGGIPLTNYMIERQQMGQSMWIKQGDVAADKTSYRDRNVAHGKRYLYRFSAENPEGLSDPLETENSIMAGTLIFPNSPGAPKVVSTSKTCIKLTWTAPPERDPPGPKLMGYQLEKRKKDTAQWIALNTVNEPIEGESYAVKDVTEGSEYQFRVSGINVSGAGDPSPPSPMTCAKNPNMKPHFKDPEDFMVVRAGNSVRIKINYEAEPPPDITWLKDGEPVSAWLNVINKDGSSQLVVPSSKRSDSGVYTIIAKNSVGQASFDIEVRVTDEPKRPGAVALEQTVHGKVEVSWEPSPDEGLDDRLHYLLSEHDSNSRKWRTVADRLFCKTYTVHTILPGREYHFRVYAKNDMGLSDPSDSPTWGINSNRVPITTNTSTAVSLDRPPSILVPLKVHTAPKGYQLYMTCAVGGYPTPTVLWYLDGVCINYDHNYYITNAQGVCSIYILRVAPKDSGAYRVVAVNSFGKAVCSTNLVVKD